MRLLGRKKHPGGSGWHIGGLSLKTKKTSGSHQAPTGETHHSTRTTTIGTENRAVTISRWASNTPGFYPAGSKKPQGSAKSARTEITVKGPKGTRRIKFESDRRPRKTKKS